MSAGGLIMLASRPSKELRGWQRVGVGSRERLGDTDQEVLGQDNAISRMMGTAGLPAETRGEEGTRCHDAS